MLVFSGCGLERLKNWVWNWRRPRAELSSFLCWVWQFHPHRPWVGCCGMEGGRAVQWPPSHSTPDWQSHGWRPIRVWRWDRASNPAAPVGNARLVSAALVNTGLGWGPPWCFHGVYSPTKVANFVSPLSSLCRFSHNQRATAFRHPVTGQISPENVDFLLQEQWVIDFCISVMVLFVWRICDALGVFVFPPAVIWCVSSEIASVFFHLIFDVTVEHMRFDFINLMW